jgi:quaternary ammonium compound-resistance protein SugE
MELPGMPWVFLFTAGLLEILATTVFRYTEGMTKIGPMIGFFIVGFASLWCLSRSLETIPLGTAYAIWTGIGAAGTAALGIIAFQEPATALRLGFIFGLIGCIVGLKLVSAN